MCNTFTYFLNTPHPLWEPGYHRWYNDLLRAGWSGVRIPADFFSSPKTVQNVSGSKQSGSFRKLTTHSHTVPVLRMGGYASTPSVRLYGVERGSLTFQITPSPRKLNCTCVNTKRQHRPDTMGLAAFFGAQELYVEWLGERAP
jgi:hypothetical protein